MKVLKRIAPFAVIVAAALLLLYIPDIGPERYTDLATFFRVERNRQSYAGYVVAAVAAGSVLYVDAFGRDGAGAPLEVGTPLYLGAGSKTFTGFAAISMVRDRLLELDRPVRDYIPWFGFAGGAGGDVTIRNLLSNTSGVADKSFDDVHDSAPDLETAVRAMAVARPAAAPGTEFHYINTGYQALGLAMEAAAGESYADIMDERIFRPLDMKGSSAAPGELVRSPPPGDSSFFGAAMPRSQAFRPFGAPSGYLVSTARDLAIFLSYLAAPEKFKRQPLSPRAVRSLFNPLVKGIPYGCGWFLVGEGGDRFAFHDGSLDGYSSRLILWPDRKAAFAIVATQNSLIQSMIALPALTEGARRIMLEGSTDRPFPLGRLYILLAVIAAVHLIALAAQTGGALRWARDVKGRTEASGTRGPLRFAAARSLLGVALRIAFMIAAPAASSLAFGRVVTWRIAFVLEPGIAAWLASACFFGILRNAARLAWLRGAPALPRGHS